jgi:hypothetical protein
MATTYSTSLQLSLMGNGDQSGTWGTTTNTNWNLIEQAVAGAYNIPMTDANYTLSVLNGVSDEARYQVLIIPPSTTLTATRTIYAPYVQKTYIIVNNSTGGQSVNIQGIVSGTPTGTALAIPNGVAVQVFCDGGTGFYSGSTGSAGNFKVNGTLSASGVTDTGALNVSGSATMQAVSGTTITAVNQFSGPGTGLTGTAAGLSIGGSSASATNATQITNVGGWNVTPSGTKLYFNYNGTNVGSLDSSGNFIVIGNVTAYGTA